jgi:hypothetical protein
VKSAGDIAIESGFLWRTMEGELLALDQMETSHVFNSMKMIFNHLAKVWGGRPVWFTKEYSDYHERSETDPARLAGLVVFFCNEITRRGDLPEKYREPFRAIVDQIVPLLELEDRPKLLTPAPRRRIE